MEAKKMSMRSPLTFIGNLLGQPKSLIINSKGFMFYIVPKFSAIGEFLLASFQHFFFFFVLKLVPFLPFTFSRSSTKKRAGGMWTWFEYSLHDSIERTNIITEKKTFYRFFLVTWNPRTPLTAEWHEVIYQSEINLVQLLGGKRGSVYAISSDVLKVDRHGRQKHSMKIHIE